MNPLTYVKAIAGGVGAGVLSPIFTWLISIIPGIDTAPPGAQTAMVALCIAVVTGGVVYATPNTLPPGK